MAQHSDARPLWRHEDPALRLAELVATDSELKVAPLRRDVRLLGTLLGHVIREQAGARADQLVSALPVDEAYHLTATATFSRGNPVKLFDLPAFTGPALARPWDVTRDGKRFIAIEELKARLSVNR